jgi:hypothetical protein
MDELTVRACRRALLLSANGKAQAIVTEFKIRQYPASAGEPNSWPRLMHPRDGDVCGGLLNYLYTLERNAIGVRLLRLPLFKFFSSYSPMHAFAFICVHPRPSVAKTLRRFFLAWPRCELSGTRSFPFLFIKTAPTAWRING